MGKQRRERSRDIVKNMCLTLGFQNRKLQVLPPILEFPKMNVKQMIKNLYVGNQR